LALTEIHPKLPMRNIGKTKAYYVGQLRFQELADYGNYLILKRDRVEIHFFEFPDLNPLENDGQVYIRVDDVDALYHEMLDHGVPIHPGGPLSVKPWGQKEFALLDPDHNLLTFGQSLA
jgi:catechol 2,3-dioxygenase-like lactoylglutathione lyase family enzyme